MIYNSLAAAGAVLKRYRYVYMDKKTAKEFMVSGHPVWFWGVWSGIPVKARIIDIKTEKGIEYADVDFIQDEECDAFGAQGVLFADLFDSKDMLLRNITEKEQVRIDEIKAKIQTKEDCILYLYNNHVAAGTEYTDWTARKAIQELAMERWGLELK